MRHTILSPTIPMCVNEMAAGIYYKDIGSRKGLTVAKSDIKYSASSENAKPVYKGKV